MHGALPGRVVYGPGRREKAIMVDGRGGVTLQLPLGPSGRNNLQCPPAIHLVKHTAAAASSSSDGLPRPPSAPLSLWCVLAGGPSGYSTRVRLK